MCTHGEEFFRGKLEEDVATYCVSVVHTSTEARVGYSYTIGLSDRGLPEIAVFGVPPEFSASILNHLAATQISLTRGLMAGDSVTGIFEDGSALRIGSVTETLGRENFRFSYERRDERGLSAPMFVQIILPDNENRFPDEEDCNEDAVRYTPMLSGDAWDFRVDGGETLQAMKPEDVLPYLTTKAGGLN